VKSAHLQVVWQPFARLFSTHAVSSPNVKTVGGPWSLTAPLVSGRDKKP